MKKWLSRIVLDILLLTLLCVVLFPVVYMITNSFKPTKVILFDRALIPHEWSLENYRDVLQKTNFSHYIINSFYVAITVTVLCTIVSAMGGYALAKYKGRNYFFKAFNVLLFVLQMFPLMLMVIPLYRTFSEMKMLNTRETLIILYVTFSLPFALWLLSGFFEGVPREMEESGTIDGCSRWQVFVRLVLPISSPGLASAAIFTFINAWNEFMIANVFVQSESQKTLPQGLTNFILQFGAEYGSLMAAATITIIPVSIFLVFTQKYIVQGLTAGAVKG